jgi:hypothetical protein
MTAKLGEAANAEQAIPQHLSRLIKRYYWFVKLRVTFRVEFWAYLSTLRATECGRSDVY